MSVENSRHECLWPMVAAIALTMVTGVFAGRNAGHDYLQFYAAGRIIAAGEDPYADAPQRREQAPLRVGIDLGPAEARGFLPFYYPPWLALTCVPAAVLPYHVGRYLSVFGAWAALAWSASEAARRNQLRPATVLVVSALTCPVLLVAVLGQTSPLVLLGAVLSVQLATAHRDRSAGMALALASLKPQLGATVIAAVLIWAAARRRWAIVGAFSATMVVLVAASTAVMPSWPWSMTDALRRTPVDTDASPWVGTTWPLLLRTLGLSGAPLVIAWAATAATLAVGMRALLRRPGSTLDRAVDFGLVAVFFLAPYARHYDLCILIPPITRRLASLPWKLRGPAAALLVVVPYVQFLLASGDGYGPIELMWIPFLPLLPSLRASHDSMRRQTAREK